MSELEEQSVKQELLTLLHNTINKIENIPDEEIIQRKTKFNVENGTGFLVTNDQFHLWIVKFCGK